MIYYIRIESNAAGRPEVPPVSFDPGVDTIIPTTEILRWQLRPS